MASPREIRRRIRSVRNTAQITRALEMVSAAKMRRAQERVRASRPYAERLRTIIAGLAVAGESVDVSQFPLLQQRPVNRVGVIIVTADRGQAGAFNTNIIRRAVRFLQEAGHPAELVTVGRKGRDFFAKTDQHVIAEFTQLGDNPSLDSLRPIIGVATESFARGDVDAVYLIYSKFINTLTQQPEALQLLPIEPPEEIAADQAVADFIFEPDAQTVLQALLPRYVEIQVYQAMLESLASEHSARMVAMRAATDNARDFIEELTLSLNKARQAQITREVSEIAAGAAALGA
ncbi:MAG TPA: ATP synthase F1 subunit gamma [Thermomicrobiales bacterium]|nr:ATP synthase F1 subunit gamma [Thermomicrobiales bacterium]